MQPANFKKSAAAAGDSGPPLDAASLEPPMNPHPAIARPQPIAATAQPTRR
jgi:hypothetical protein